MKTIQFASILILLLAFGANAQAPLEQEPLPQPILEKLAKLRIEEEKKDFEKLIAHAKDLADLSEELERNFEKLGSLKKSNSDSLLKLENLVAEIREDLGSRDAEKETSDIPKTTKAAIAYLKEHSASLYESIKDSSRHSVSVTAIRTSNALFNVVKFVRSSVRQNKD